MKKVFTKLLAIVIAVMLILSACPIAFAADDDIASGTAGDGINWVIDAAGTLTISGEGAIVVDWYAPPWEDYNDSILNIVVREGITKIPSTAFCYAYNLETLSIPASVTDISYMMFWGESALREINVNADNENYISVDGILFSKDMTRLCAYPSSKAGDNYTIPGTVTTVGRYAFIYNQTLQSVTIPDTVTALENDAFYGACIKSVTIGNGIKTIPINCFNYCDIESIVIPDSVEAISDSAFYNCNNLQFVTIGSGVKSIGSTAFTYCDSLTAIHYIGTEAQWGEITIAEDNDVLLNTAIHYLTEDSYKEATIADCDTDGHTAGFYCDTCAAYVTGEITESAWGHDFVDSVCKREGCGDECEHISVGSDFVCIDCEKANCSITGTAGDGITWALNTEGTLTISGEGEIVVDWYAPPWEDYNDSILNIVVEEGITKIPSTAFCYAENLETVSVPASVIDMDDGTTIFWDCYALREINVDTDNKNYVSVDGVVFTEDMTTLCFYPANKTGESYTIPDSVTTVKCNAFQSNQTLKSVIIPDTVTALEMDLFYASDIKSITIGSGIKTIPTSCFSGCNIESIVIPDSVEVIGGSAFYGCNALKTVTIGSGVKSIGGTAFAYCDSLTAIHYIGTEAQWGEITIAEDNDVLLNVAVHYLTEDNYKEGFDIADCTTDGHTGGLYCEECDIFATGSALTAPGHNYVDGICSVCETPCEHVHQDLDGICDICGEDVGFNEIKVGETKTAYINTANTAVYVKFVAETDGEFVITSDMGNNNIDPYVTLYDSEGNEIEYDDDNGYALDFELVFYAEAGETYYIALNAYNDGSEYTYTLDKYITITHQPTATEPYVELNDETDTTYQWFTAEYSFTEITDQNADTVSYDWGTTSYDSENGWTGVMDAWQTEDCFDFFTVSLKAGDFVAVEITGDFNDAGLYDYATESVSSIVSSDGSAAMLTVQEDGDYTFYVYADSADITVKAYLVDVSVTEIKGETSATLKNPVVGTLYTCGIVAQGKVLVSDVFEYTYFITHQPTSAEPYVGLNEDEGVTYQWYEAKEETVELTDENVTLIDITNTGTLPTYDSENGWTGVTADGTVVYYGTVALKAGDTITITSDGNATNIVMLTMTEDYQYDDAEFDENGAAVLTAPADGEYSIITNASALLKMYKEGYTYTAIEGQTTNALTDATIGTAYLCEIAAGEYLLVSDILEYTYAITHQPTRKEPYVEVNDGTGATYQWYTISGEFYEITDKEVSPIDRDGTGESTYNSESGWNDISSSDVELFNIYLEEGEKIELYINGTHNTASIWDYEQNIGEVASRDDSGAIVLTAPASGTYTVASDCARDATIKAYFNTIDITRLEGETEAKLKTTDKNTYFCVVTFADGSIEVSNILDTNYIIGDANDDGEVNTRDAALVMQYANGWDVTINLASADVNGDGTVNTRDYALLMQYANGWDVTF